MENIILVVAIAVVVPLVFQLFYFLRRREEKKCAAELQNRTRMPKAISWFFLGAALLFFAVMVIGGVCCIVEKEPLSTLAILVVGFGIIVGLCLFGFFYMRFRYEIYDAEKITVVRLFKRKDVYFKDISYYSYSKGIAGGLIAYDINGIPLFSSEGMNSGIDKFVYEFSVHGIMCVDKTFFTYNFNSNKKYCTYKRKTFLKIGAWVCFGFGIFGLLLFSLLFTGASYRQYENYEVRGIIEDCDYGKTTITIRLGDDDNVYYVNNIVFEKVSAYFNYDVKMGEEIVLDIAYADKQGRLNISQIEFGGKIYLNKAVAEEAERENYFGLRNFSYVVLAVSILLLIAWVTCLIVLKVKFGRRKENEETVVS